MPSEDPFLTGIYAAGMISGAVEEDQGVPRMLMYMKHFGERCPDSPSLWPVGLTGLTHL